MATDAAEKFPTTENTRAPARRPALPGPTVTQVVRHLAVDMETLPITDREIGLTTWIEDLSPSLSRAGLTLSRCPYSAREVIHYADADAIFLTCSTGDAGQPLIVIVVPAFKGRARVTTIDGLRAQTQTLSPTQLASRLGLTNASEPTTWGLIDQTRPLENLRTPQGRAPDPVRYLKQLMRLERHSLRAIIIYALVVGVLTLATPLAVQSLVNTIAFGTLLQPLVILTLLLLAGLLVAGGLRVLETVVIEYLQRRVFTRTAADMATRLSGADLEANRGTDLRELTNRFLDVATLQKVSASLLLDGLGLALQTAIGLLVLAFYHPLLLAFDVVLVLLLLVILRVVGRRAVSTAVSESNAKYAVLAWLENMAAAAPLLRARRRRIAAIDRADHLTHAYLEAREQHFSRVLRQVGGLVLLQAVASAGLLGLGGWLVMTGQLTLGQLVASELIVTAVVGSMAKFGKHLENFYDASAAVDKIGKVIDLPMTAAKRGRPKTDEQLALNVCDATLRNDRGQTILERVSLTVEPNTCVALTGDAGSGKSLFLSAMAGFVAPSHGEIQLSGDALDRLEAWSVGDLVRLLQDTTLIPGTFYDNICFYDHAVSEADALALIKRLGGERLLAAFPEGLHTEVEGTGQILSGDLKVLLCLTRELINRPSVVLIDGLLDAVSPPVKQATLDVLTDSDAPWSAVIATHHPEVIAACHRTVQITDRAVLERPR